MLVLKRYVGEKILIGDDIVITVAGVRGGKVVLGVEAPPHVLILRSELACDNDHEPEYDLGGES